VIRFAISIHKEGGSALAAGQSALAAEFLHRRKHLVVRFALQLDTPGYFDADAFDRPAAKVLVQVARCGFQLEVCQFAVEGQHPILHRARLRH